MLLCEIWFKKKKKILGECKVGEKRKVLENQTAQKVNTVHSNVTFTGVRKKRRCMREKMSHALVTAVNFH